MLHKEHLMHLYTCTWTYATWRRRTS